MHMSKGASAWDQLSTDSAQLLLCDLQPEIVACSKTIDPDVLSKSVGALLEIAEMFSLPTTLSVVPERDKAPALISELRGSGFAHEKLCASSSPSLDEATKNLLAQSGRKVLIIGGFATEAAHVLNLGPECCRPFCWLNPSKSPGRNKAAKVICLDDFACGARRPRARLRRIGPSGRLWRDIRANRAGCFKVDYSRGSRHQLSCVNCHQARARFHDGSIKDLFNIVQRLRLT